MAVFISIIEVGADWGNDMTVVLIALGGGILLGLRWRCIILVPTTFVVVVVMTG